MLQLIDIGTMRDMEQSGITAFILAGEGVADWTRGMSARARRVVGIGRVVTVFPVDGETGHKGDAAADAVYAEGANEWERLLHAAEQAGADVVIAFQQHHALFHAASVARAADLRRRAGADLVFPCGFVNGAAPLVFSRRALAWAVAHNRESAVPLPPDRLILSDASQDFICASLAPPPFLNRPELAITNDFIEQFNIFPPDNEVAEEDQKYYENLVAALDAEKKKIIAAQCGRFADTLFVSRAAPPDGRARVLLIANVTRVGGAETSLLLLAQRLDRNSFEPVIACPGPGELADRAREAGIETEYYDLASVGQGPAAFLASAGSLAQIIREKKIHLAHCNSIYACQMSVAAARAAGVPIVCHVHDLTVAPEIINNAMLPACTGIIAVSQAVAKEIKAWGGPEENIGVLYNGIDLNIYRPGLPRGAVRHELNIEDAPVITMIAHLVAWKGQRVFIDAAALVLRDFPSAHFIIAGSELFPGRHGGFENSLKKQIARLGLEHSIHLLGAREDVPAVLADTDVFVHASLLPDPYPYTVLEAMACGLPVIGANAGGVSEQLDHGRAGILTPPGDTAALADTVRSLLIDRERARALGMTARRHAEQYFDINACISRVQDYYRSIIQTRLSGC